MRRKAFSTILTIGVAALIGFSHNFTALAQKSDAVLKLNQETKFVLKNKDEKVVLLNLKKDDFTEISCGDNLQRVPTYSIITPTGRDVSKELYSDSSIMFIAPEDGTYKLKIRFDDAENNVDAEVRVSYNNVFKLPKAAKLARQKKVNGYDVQVYNVEDESATYLLIKKDGKLKQILEGGSLVGGGFNFADVAAGNDGAEAKKSALLMRTTADKTGDGTPDIAVGFFTGGAHCCFDLHFFELGTDAVKHVKVIEGEDSDIVAVGKQPNGGLILRTGDSNFAYWLTSFAGSPIPEVILTYQNGEFRPDVKLMKKPPLSAAVLKQKADKARKEIDLTPYVNEEDSHFLDAFWGEMIDLMYAGNETAAWQYFDQVWDKRKPGKEKFKADFLKKLNDSEYWQQMHEGRN